MSKAASNEALRTCLLSAVAAFNDSHDCKSLLAPRKNTAGQVATQGQSGWGAASERAIAHRLAYYLERELRRKSIVRDDARITVDCEYNRHLDGSKEHRIPRDLVRIVEKAKRTVTRATDDENYYVFSIAPDIVVHRRGTDKYNLLVVEVKKTTNRECEKYDQLKLECFTGTGAHGYAYKVGAAVTALDDVPPAQRQLEVTTWYPRTAA